MVLSLFLLYPTQTQRERSIHCFTALHTVWTKQMRQTLLLRFWRYWEQSNQGQPGLDVLNHWQQDISSQKHCIKTQHHAGFEGDRMKYKKQNEREWCSSKKSAWCVCVCEWMRASEALLIHTGLWSLAVWESRSLLSNFIFQYSLLSSWYSPNQAPRGIIHPIPPSMIHCHTRGWNLTTNSNRKLRCVFVLLCWEVEHRALETSQFKGWPSRENMLLKGSFGN